ncbi:MAG: ankyrin repeat domain-containing protein, partial [Terriglobus roseus]|nr:ankyrin repeat domain-containing protein [Terriglobus roseus]
EGEKIPLPSQPSREQPVDQQDSDIESQIVQAANVENASMLKELLVRTSGLPDASERISRAFLQAAEEAPESSLRVILDTRGVNLALVDEINQRNVLHKAAVSGRDYLLRWGLEADVDVHQEDVYGRIPLHYACVHGRLDLATALLERGPDTINDADHDNFTPLIHSIVQSRLMCVQMLLQHGARIDPLTEIDSIPLNLACQYGSIPIVQELLQRHPQILPDAEGLYPQHLVSRSSGVPEILILLKEYGANLDQPDKLYQWTPLFHAASEGNLKCVQTLLDCGVNPDILDEKGLDALYYSTWERHLDCISLLATVTHVKRHYVPMSANTSPLAGSVQSSATPLPLASDADSIPPIVLPPPIIPVRRYGHNFLESKTYVVVNFGNLGYDAIQFYDDQKYPAARLTMSSKSSDLIPRNINLPIPDDSRVVSFQIDDLDTFVMDFDVYPTFGAKIICRAVASSKVFTCRISASGHWHLELLDPRLHAIGRISFNFQVVKPFSGTPLEITHFATYWKATSQLDTHQPSALITGSSLSGDYARLFVQATSDGAIVLYPQWKLNHYGLEVPVSSITYDQFAAIGAAQRTPDQENGLSALRQTSPANIPEIHSLLATTFLRLQDALDMLPPTIHVELHIVYPSRQEEEDQKLGPTLNINDFADSLLTVVFDHARALREQSDGFTRSIVFSSFNADICTALNWKQPNCTCHVQLSPPIHWLTAVVPILLCNELGIEVHDGGTGKIPSSGRTTLSVKEAVQTAQNNNFMGLICSSRLLGLAPALVDSIKTAGLVLINDVSNGDALTGQPMSASMTSSSGGILSPDRVDGTFQANGVLKFNASVDM